MPMTILDADDPLSVSCTDADVLDGGPRDASGIDARMVDVPGGG